MRNAALNTTAGGKAAFASTQWGILQAAAEREHADGRREAWEDLYRIYCYPVYAFIRRWGRSRPEAQDLTQDFFVHLVEKDTLSRADARKGQFRTFLLGALEYFLLDAERREGARKRGGGCQFVFLDDPDAAEQDYQLAAAASQTPERLFEARWATALVDAAYTRMREEMAAAAKSALFQALSGYVVGEEQSPYQATADALGLSLPALKSTIHRLRSRYLILLREEVARTVSARDEVDAELRHLRAALQPD